MAEATVIDAKSVNAAFQADGKVVVGVTDAAGGTHRIRLDAAAADELYALLGQGLSAMRQNPAAP